jgi:hypothetical protein
LKNTFLKDHWVRAEIREEIKKFLEFNDNENTTCRNLWDTAKAVHRVKFIAMSVYIKNRMLSHKWPNSIFQIPRKARTS